MQCTSSWLWRFNPLLLRLLERWVLVGTNSLGGSLSALPSAPLLLHSPPWLWSSPFCHPQSPPAKGLPSVWKPFLLHSSLPLVQVPSLFFCLCFFFFLWPYPGCGEFLAFWEVWGLLPAFSRCSIGVVPHVDVFLMYLWRGRWSPHLTFPPSWSQWSSLWFWVAFPWWLVMLSTFSCTCRLFWFLLWKRIYTGPLPINYLNCLFVNDLYEVLIYLGY